MINNNHSIHHYSPVLIIIDDWQINIIHYELLLSMFNHHLPLLSLINHDRTLYIYKSTMKTIHSPWLIIINHNFPIVRAPMFDLLFGSAFVNIEVPWLLLKSWEVRVSVLVATSIWSMISIWRCYKLFDWNICRRKHLGGINEIS